MFKKVLLMTGIVAFPLLAFVGLALAHVPAAEATCKGLAVQLVKYEQWKTNPPPPYNNVVQINVDGNTEQFVFAHEFTTYVEWDMSKPHTWAVKVDANLHQGDPTKWDVYLSGTSEACVTTTTAEEATTTTATATVIDTVPPTSVTVATPPLVPPAPAALPATGNRTDILLAVSLGMAAIGWCLVLIGRNRRYRRSLHDHTSS